MTIEEVIRVLLNYESNGTKPIVVTGPDFTQKNKLRVYLNGGLIGKISVGKGKNDLLSSDYKNYANGYADDLKPKKGKDTLDTLVSTEYLNAAAFATNNRFMKSNSNSEAEKERNIETQIVTKYMYHPRSNWRVIDMEVQCPKKWLDDAKLSPKTTRSPRFDLVVYSSEDKSIGIVELKVDNENCQNLLGHYEHMCHIASKKEFVNEMIRRTEILKKYKVIDTDISIASDKKVWFGYLFVGGDENDSRNKIKKELGSIKDISSDCKFLYVKDVASLKKTGLIYKKMQSFDEFTKGI